MKWMVTAVRINRRSRKRVGKGRQQVIESTQTDPKQVELEFERIHSDSVTISKVVDVRHADGSEPASEPGSIERLLGEGRN